MLYFLLVSLTIFGHPSNVVLGFLFSQIRSLVCPYGRCILPKTYVSIGSGTRAVGESYDTIEIIELLLHLRTEGYILVW